MRFAAPTRSKQADASQQAQRRGAGTTSVDDCEARFRMAIRQPKPRDALGQRRVEMRDLRRGLCEPSRALGLAELVSAVDGCGELARQAATVHPQVTAKRLVARMPAQMPRSQSLDQTLQSHFQIGGLPESAPIRWAEPTHAIGRLGGLIQRPEAVGPRIAWLCST